MKKLLFSNEIKYLKIKMYLLYLLNVTDIVFTYILINTGMFEERNKILIPIINNKNLTLIIKVIFILMLVIYINFRLKKANEKQRFISNIIILIILSFYILINISHIFWILVVNIV